MDLIQTARLATKVATYFGAGMIVNGVIKAFTPQNLNVIKSVVVWVGGGMLASVIVNAAVKEVDPVFDMLESLPESFKQINN